MKKLLYIICLALSLNILAIPVSLADVSQEQAAQIAQSRYPGRVIDVKSSNSSYRVKILDSSGTMHIVVVDKQSGNIKSAN